LVGLRGGQDLITHLVGISSIEDLPKLDRFQQLLSEGKTLHRHDQVGRLSAETALAQLAREKIKRLDDVRSLIDKSSAPKSILFPTSKIKLLPRVYTLRAPKLMTKSVVTSAQK
jgi:hypothetical protein